VSDQDPRKPFSSVSSPIVIDTLSQWTPPLKPQHYAQLQREINDDLFGLGVKAVEVDGQMLLDDAGQPVRCVSVDEGGSGPYRVFIRFMLIPEAEQLTT
jgi:hypothetical protein